jgi:nitrogen fixation/metabolism regulation signal transduction histidine kinase
MEDHGGDLVLADRKGAGARVSLIFRRRDESSGPAQLVGTHDA